MNSMKKKFILDVDKKKFFAQFFFHFFSYYFVNQTHKNEKNGFRFYMKLQLMPT